jgi:hypothetical protein
VSATIQTCYITAPAGSNLSVLTDALRRRGIRVIVPQNLAMGEEPGAEISKQLANVDLVIGVLTRERRSEWVLFELGQAWALGKRILLFAPPKTAHLPSTLRRFLTVRANLSNQEAIDFALDQLLVAPEPKLKSVGSRDKTRPLGASASTYLDHSVALANSAETSEMESLVANALREAGVETVVAAGGRDHGADLAVWSDGLQLSVGNPLLVEIRAGRLSSKATSVAAQRLSYDVAASGGRWGLLLLANGLDEPRWLPPNVVALSIESLFRRLQNEPFDDIIRDLRNRRVHGESL